MKADAGLRDRKEALVANDSPESLPDGPDLELARVRDHLLYLDPQGVRVGRILRDSIDQLLDGEHTGRYAWKSLYKTEKTHAGTIVEINLRRNFALADGIEMDYSIQGIDVDCKFSQEFGGWMIPPEAVGHICLLVWANDELSRWSAGLLRVHADLLRGGTNRDRKVQLKASSLARITPLWFDASLPENVLLHLEPGLRDRILIEGKQKGQARVNALFGLVQGKPIGRGVVRTAAQQSDYMARVRTGKGRARTVLRGQGIIIPGPFRNHQDIARALGAPVPGPGEFISLRVAKRREEHGDRPYVRLDSADWVLADDNDPPETAPLLPDAQGPAADN
ncbi:hypothetical protein GCM10009760_21480 [Kitasatospora kazusensis]|uniref:Type II restriction enzyme NaeI domain-containing protein n=2 Tax=Kitasatospora kazusensis TaxID=407974 RepID=A0ABP5L1X4_9ACTN